MQLLEKAKYLDILVVQENLKRWRTREENMKWNV